MDDDHEPEPKTQRIDQILEDKADDAEEENRSNEFDRAARSQIDQALMASGLPTFLLAPASAIKKEGLTELAGWLESRVQRFSIEFLQSMISHLPWNVLEGLIFLLSNLQVEEYIQRSKKVEWRGVGRDRKRGRERASVLNREFSRLDGFLSQHSDSIYESLLRTGNMLKRNLSQSHMDAKDILPCRDLFESSGKAIPALQHRLLTQEEEMHPFLPPKAPQFSFHPGTCSSVASLRQFHRGFQVFTMGLLQNVNLAQEEAFVSGSAVLACMLPWPPQVQQVKHRENTYVATLVWVFKYHFGLAKECILRIFDYDVNMVSVRQPVNEVLLEWFMGMFPEADVDLWVVGKSKEDAAIKLTNLYRQIDHNRRRVNLEEWFKGGSSNVWWNLPRYKTRVKMVRPTPEELDLIQKMEDIELAIAQEMNITPDVRSHKLTTENPILRWLPTYRSPNSVTIAGVYPIRHVQVCTPIIRNAEELVWSFDLDCVTAYYDGRTVRGTPRFIRSLNTLTNYVGPNDIKVPVRSNRIIKYMARGFQPVLFEVCKHIPRCDVFPKAPVELILRSNGPIQDRAKAWYSPISLPFGPSTGPDELNSASRNSLMRRAFQVLPNKMTSDPQDMYNMLLGNTSEIQLDFPPVAWMWQRDELKSLRADTRVVSMECYMCKAPVVGAITKVTVCESCTRINESKRNMRVDLSGKVALVTGGRTKIGYSTAVSLLRMGCTCYITTRYPHLAAEKYQKEKDSSTWWPRLNIVGIDFRRVDAVIKFIESFKEEVSWLDILINNAAQTIRPSQQIAAALKAKEESQVLGEEVLRSIRRYSPTSAPALIQGGYDEFVASDTSTQLSATLAFQGDAPLDTRQNTSWNMSLQDLPQMEVAEVLVVNSLVPALLIQGLAPLMTSQEAYLRVLHPDPRFVVNVTSPEGHSQQPQSSSHPHTNMSKASLNRLTQTVAIDMAKKGVYVNAVDPGWVSIMVHPLDTNKVQIHLSRS
eukprot:TRINITY_DN843_c2_g1_i3.p1 TRINITY_DN843_c2_g1~~TRINITY_DN843_c2_g1_i3.p1  ORF type:complete len:1021 (+),score=198.44 TRINITY_DN843_c2_g1_i3:113-3064(+)